MSFFRILVVEDYEPFRRLICLALQQRPDFQVTQASDGLEAVQKARETQPDIVLMDIGLPKLNGIEAAKRIRRLAPKTKLLFVTQESHTEVVRETFRLGGRGYVHKALAATDLLPAIDAVIGGKRFVSSDLDFNDCLEATHSRHEVQFLEDDSVFLNTCAPFIANALGVADATIVIATKPHRESLIEKLKADGFDIDSAIQQGTYISIDAHETLSTIIVNGVPDTVRFFNGIQSIIDSVGRKAETDHPRVVFLGECAGLMCAEGNSNAAIRLERMANDLIRTHGVEILCPYPFHGQEDDPVLKSICAEHTTVYRR